MLRDVRATLGERDTTLARHAIELVALPAEGSWRTSCQQAARMPK